MPFPPSSTRSHESDLIPIAAAVSGEAAAGMDLHHHDPFSRPLLSDLGSRRRRRLHRGSGIGDCRRRNPNLPFSSHFVQMTLQIAPRFDLGGRFGVPVDLIFEFFLSLLGLGNGVVDLDRTEEQQLLRIERSWNGTGAMQYWVEYRVLGYFAWDWVLDRISNGWTHTRGCGSDDWKPLSRSRFSPELNAGGFGSRSV